MVVRMSNNIISYNYLSGLNKALYKQTKSMDQLVSQKRLTRPSDNPVDTVLDMRYKVNLCENEQYDKNSDLALSWMNTTYDAMESTTEIYHRVRELIISAAKPNPDIAYEAVAEEIDGLLNQMIQISNSTLGDRYIFAGQADREKAPFYLKKGDYTQTPPIQDEVIYTGDSNKISMVVSAGSSNPSLDGVNVSGSAMFNDCKFFKDLINLRDALRDPVTMLGTDDPTTFLSGEALAKTDENIDHLLTVQSHLSARVSMYELGKNILGSSNVRITSNIAGVEDVDIGKASIAFTVAQNAYQAALAMGAKLLPMSLTDFLR